MKIRLEDNLLNYMHAHHKNTIMLKLVHDDYSGYDMNSKHPKVLYYKPRHPEYYDIYTVNDITVFVEKEIRAAKEELVLEDEKHFGLHQCHVDGIDLETNKSTIVTFGPD